MNHLRGLAAHRVRGFILIVDHVGRHACEDASRKSCGNRPARPRLLGRQAPEALNGLLDEVANIGFVADISADDFRFRVQVAEFGGEGVTFFFAAAADHDAGAFAGECQALARPIPGSALVMRMVGWFMTSAL